MRMKYVLSLLAPLVIAAMVPTVHAQSTDSVTCTDGTMSKAKGRGACSGHGGVKKDAAAADSTVASPPMPAAEPAATKASKAKKSMEIETAAASAGGGSTCKDGTTSAKTGRGACSGHGGVAKSGDAMSAPSVAAPAATSAAPEPAAAPMAKAPMAASPASSMSSSKTAPTVKAAATDPEGATAKCKDGTYSHAANHTGACSHHGGVGEWLAK